MGSTLKTPSQKKVLIKGLGLGLIILLYSFAAFPGGIGLDFSVVTVNLSGALDKVSQAASNALAELGLPAQQINQLVQDLDGQVTDIRASFPVEYFPLPLVGGTLEFGLPFIVIDKAVFSGGLLNDSILRGIASTVGYSIPKPLVPNMTIDLGGGDTANISADVGLSVFKFTGRVAKHFDVFIGGVELGAGVDFVNGKATPAVTANAPGHQTELDAALEALHLDGLGWNAFTTNVSGQIELGPPFLRLVLQAAYQLPISQASDWWDIKSGIVSGKIGLAVRF
jgi:hypothetical protein